MVPVKILLFNMQKNCVARQVGEFMKFVKLGSKYAFKNCWWLALIWLLPSVFVGLFCGPFQLIEFMNIYPTTAISGFVDVFKILMPISWQRVVCVILGVLLVAVFLSLAVGETESHMRGGKLIFKDIFSCINNDVLVVLINVVVLEVIYLALTFIFGCVIFLFHLMLCGLGTSPSVLCSILAIVLCCVLLVLLTIMSALFLINIPNMMSNGYSFKVGVSSTAQLISKNTFKLLVAYILPYALIIPLVCGLCKTDLSWLANILSFLILSVSYSAVTMTSYFELSDTSRYDNRKYYNYK